MLPTFTLLGVASAISIASACATGRTAQTSVDDQLASTAVDVDVQSAPAPESTGEAAAADDRISARGPHWEATPEMRILHPFARQYVHFADFSWWRLEILNLRYVGGFGVMGWSSGAEYADATPDPVLPFAAPMIEHLDADHADVCISIVRHLAGVTDAVSAPVSSIDRYGMTFDVYGAEHRYLATARVAFPHPLTSPDDVRAASVELVRRATA